MTLTRRPRLPSGKIGVTAGANRPYIPASRAQTNGSVAPVCPISRPQAFPPQPGIQLPFVPLANDLPSAIQAINALHTIIASTGPASIRWLEKERVTQQVRITNPQDSSQYVDVLRITKLTMQDQITGDLWVFALDGSMPSKFNG